jgi:hypothetical protein
MPKSVNGVAGPISLKPTKRKPRQAPSAEELVRLEEARVKREAERVFQARVKYDRWARSLFSGFWEHNDVPLVTPADESEEGLFEPDEFELLSTTDLTEYRMCFDEAIETLQSLKKELDAALEAREAAGR